MSDYPPPAHAVMIWRSGDQLMIRVPPAPGHDKGHVLNFPFDTAGVGALKLVLTHREAEPSAKIGTRAVPVQSMLRAMKITTVVKTTYKETGELARERKRRSRLEAKAAAQREIEDLINDELDDLLEDL